MRAPGPRRSRPAPTYRGQRDVRGPRPIKQPAQCQCPIVQGAGQRRVRPAGSTTAVLNLPWSARPEGAPGRPAAVRALLDASDMEPASSHGREQFPPPPPAGELARIIGRILIAPALARSLSVDALVAMPVQLLVHLGGAACLRRLIRPLLSVLSPLLPALSFWISLSARFALLPCSRILPLPILRCRLAIAFLVRRFPGRLPAAPGPRSNTSLGPLPRS